MGSNWDIFVTWDFLASDGIDATFPLWDPLSRFQDFPQQDSTLKLQTLAYSMLKQTFFCIKGWPSLITSATGNYSGQYIRVYIYIQLYICTCIYYLYIYIYIHIQIYFVLFYHVLQIFFLFISRRKSNHKPGWSSKESHQCPQVYLAQW